MLGASVFWPNVSPATSCLLQSVVAEIRMLTDGTTFALDREVRVYSTSVGWADIRKRRRRPIAIPFAPERTRMVFGAGSRLEARQHLSPDFG